jgi:hypothetical protein
LPVEVEMATMSPIRHWFSRVMNSVLAAQAGDDADDAGAGDQRHEVDVQFAEDNDDADNPQHDHANGAQGADERLFAFAFFGAAAVLVMLADGAVDDLHEQALDDDLHHDGDQYNDDNSGKWVAEEAHGCGVGLHSSTLSDFPA